MTTGTSTDCPKSKSSFCNQTTSHATIVAPLYYASVFDNATIGCFLLLQLKVSLPKENMKPLVDLLSKTFSAQLASMYVMSIIEYNYVCIKDKIVTPMNITCVNYVKNLPWGPNRSTFG